MFPEKVVYVFFIIYYHTLVVVCVYVQETILCGIFSSEIKESYILFFEPKVIIYSRRVCSVKYLHVSVGNYMKLFKREYVESELVYTA